MKIEQIAYTRGYRVTIEGLFLNPSGKEIGYFNNQGYLETRIRINKKQGSLRCHRLQAFQKYGVSLYNTGILTRHKDGVQTNNAWSNILIGTHSDNMMDIPKQIRIKKAQHATSFIRKHDKSAIQKYYNTVKSYKKTMSHFQISSKGTLHWILNN